MKKLSPILWSLFAAGGTIAALLFPIHIFLVGLAFPLGWIDAPSHEELTTLIRLPLTRLYLFMLITLPLFHSVGIRLRYTLYDGLKLRHLEPLIIAVCYGTALFLSLTAAVMLIRFS